MRKRSSSTLRTLSSAGMLASALFALTGLASATILNTSGGGTLNFGNISVQVVSTANPAVNCINFYNSASPDACDTSGSDTFSVNAPVDPGLFVLGSTGHIKDIPQTVGLPETAFITTPGAGALGTISFDLLSLVVPGSVPCPPATTPGVCDLPGSPFVFTVTDSSHVTVSFAANLCGYSGASGGGSSCSTGTLYTASFSAQFAGANANLFSLISSAQTLAGITDSMSATLNPVSTVPEPITSVLFGSGLLGLSLVLRRFRAR